MRMLNLKKINKYKAKNNFYSILKTINENSEPIEIIGDSEEDSAVIISKSEFKSIQESLYLINDGTLNKIQLVLNDDSGEIDITDGIDWENI